MPETADYIRKSIDEIRARIAAAAVRSGRAAGDVTLVVVSKMRDAEEIRSVIRCGVRDIAENRVQEAERKKPEISESFTFHLVGHLQSNKARKAVQLFDVVQSVDSVHLAEKLSAEAAAAGRVMPVLVELNISGEASKSGFSPSEVEAAVQSISGLDSLEVKGLMTIGPLTPDSEAVRRAFRETRRLFESAGRIAPLNVLSMGMSDDFEIAIEEGSTMVRIGRAVFEGR